MWSESQLVIKVILLGLGLGLRPVTSDVAGGSIMVVAYTGRDFRSNKDRGWR